MATMTGPVARPLIRTEKAFLIEGSAVSRARRFARDVLADFDLDDDHVYTVTLIVSELVTNAIRYGGDDRLNISLRIRVWPRWTEIVVDDRDPCVYPRGVNGSDLAESGRGLNIVRAYAERFWWAPRLISKTANAVILRKDVELTVFDNAILDRLENGEAVDE